MGRPSLSFAMPEGRVGIFDTCQPCGQTSHPSLSAVLKSNMLSTLMMSKSCGTNTPESAGSQRILFGACLILYDFVLFLHRVNIGLPCRGDGWNQTSFLELLECALQHRHSSASEVVHQCQVLAPPSASLVTRLSLWKPHSMTIYTYESIVHLSYLSFGLTA